MAKVEMYSTMWCPFCHRARRVLDDKGVDYVEYDIYATPAKRGEMVERSGGRNTVPQIFIDGRHIGGSDELAALDRRGALDPLLAAAS